MNKLILKCFLAPGDILVLTATVRDLHRTHPGKYLTDVRTHSPDIWENNPYITPLDENDAGVQVIDCHAPLINESNALPFHFQHGFRLFLEEVLGVEIRPHAFQPDIHLSPEERLPLSDGLSEGLPLWILVAGGKRDLTVKWWDTARFQKVVDHFQGRVRFVQCGAGREGYHVHPTLTGVTDMVGKTSLRDLIRLMHHASGVICPVTMFMHLAAAVETRPGRSILRPCVVVAGGREPAHWEAYPGHTYLHTIGCLPCCDAGGCWKCRVVPLSDGLRYDNDLCLLPVECRPGVLLPRCMDLIRAEDVIAAVDRYLTYETTYQQVVPLEGIPTTGNAPLLHKGRVSGLRVQPMRLESEKKFISEQPILHTEITEV